MGKSNLRIILAKEQVSIEKFKSLARSYYSKRTVSRMIKGGRTGSITTKERFVELLNFITQKESSNKYKVQHVFPKGSSDYSQNLSDENDANGEGGTEDTK